MDYPDTNQTSNTDGNLTGQSRLSVLTQDRVHFKKQHLKLVGTSRSKQKTSGFSETKIPLKILKDNSMLCSPQVLTLLANKTSEELFGT